jgi:hypothetical protein
MSPMRVGHGLRYAMEVAVPVEEPFDAALQSACASTSVERLLDWE